jgi:hypothetical protein
VDDDCDGLVDAADPDMATPSNFCDQDGPCAGSSPQCQGASGWRCNYGSNVDVASNGAVAVVESRCDNIDNNCNGQVDETFPLKGTGCTVGNGRCSASSTYACTVDTSSVYCPAAAVPTNARNETCNGVDDNCDGNVDERTPTGSLSCYDAGPGSPAACQGWIDPMVRLGASANVWMYAYEASRPDASNTSAGIATTRACSVENRLPWDSLNRAEAAAACAAIRNSAGQPMRLCSVTEWETACEGASGVTTTPLWSYSTVPGTHVDGRCNDNAAGVGGPWPVGRIANGNASTCYTPWNGGADRIYDLSGNLAEWTGTTATVNGQTYYRVRGGNYQTFPMGTRCDFNFVLEKPDFQNFDVGFRCCSDAAP